MNAPLNRIEQALRSELGAREILVDLIQVGVDVEALMKDKGGQYLVFKCQERIAADLQRVLMAGESQEFTMTAVHDLRVNYGIMKLMIDTILAGRSAGDELSQTASGNDIPIY